MGQTMMQHREAMAAMAMPPVTNTITQWKKLTHSGQQSSVLQGEGRDVAWRPGPAQHCPSALGLLKVDLCPWCQDWFTLGSKGKLQDKEGGQRPGYQDPQPLRVSSRARS